MANKRPNGYENSDGEAQGLPITKRPPSSLAGTGGRNALHYSQRDAFIELAQEEIDPD
jgi:hypothetical protein